MAVCRATAARCSSSRRSTSKGTWSRRTSGSSLVTSAATTTSTSRSRSGRPARTTASASDHGTNAPAAANDRGQRGPSRGSVHDQADVILSLGVTILDVLRKGYDEQDAQSADRSIIHVRRIIGPLNEFERVVRR